LLPSSPEYLFQAQHLHIDRELALAAMQAIHRLQTETRAFAYSSPIGHQEVD
jgi:hypothetical protein